MLKNSFPQTFKQREATNLYFFLKRTQLGKRETKQTPFPHRFSSGRARDE